ncbi:MAG: PEP-CTERM sorting domain-containing protein [Bryobacteraceae bacterium]
MAAVLFVGLVQSSFGTTITSGSFDFGGTIFVTEAVTSAPIVTPAGTCTTVGEQCIFWEDTNGATANKVDISSANLPNGNIPLAINGNDAADIYNLTNPPETVGGTGFTPTEFMTFNNDSISTELLIDYIASGMYASAACTSAPAPGQTCTLAGSLFNFANNPPAPGQATATWVLEGTTNTPGVTWIGNFTSQFNVPYQTVFGELTTQGYASDTFSGTITLTPAATTPEPDSLGLMAIGTGLIGFAAFFRRRRVTR